MKKKVKLEISPKQFFNKNRRGSHIDVVISFVIFIIFLGFLYSIISPAKVQENKEAILNQLENEIKDKLSANLTSTPITLTGTRDCFKINYTINPEGLNVIVKNETNDLVKFGYEDNSQGPITKYLKIDGTPKMKFFKIYYSEEEFKGLDLTTSSCTFAPSTYDLEVPDDNPPIKQVGLIRTEKYIFETKVERAFKDADSYKEVKESLNVPYGSEFSFNFTFNDGTSVAWENKKVSTNTYAREVPVQYINQEANITLGYLNIKVW